MTSASIQRELDLVFGEGSIGESYEERAKTSNARFVRSQLQLAPYSDRATGRVLTASEALHAFGWEAVRRAALDGSAPLVSSPSEPAETLRKRREELGLQVEELARRTHLPATAVRDAETPGIRSPIRAIEALGQALALDERLLGVRPSAGGDSVLGVRLREMANSGDVAAFTPATVLQLSEAAWVISRQAALQSELGPEYAPPVRLPRHDPSFGYPAYDIGYRLANKTRQLLGIDAESPIESVRLVVEDDFGLSLVQQQMSPRFAGATMANGSARGIVINETGMNANVWVRRMTMCHELGHLLWDPDDRLHKVMVDEYADIEQDVRDTRRDPPEIRANAFAVAFLAPPSAIREIAATNRDPIAVVAEVMTTFGISATAAKHHVRNVTGLNAFGLRHAPLPEPNEEWIAMENLALDFFPLHATPLSRRGKFAWCVANLCSAGLITLDTAASLLMCPPTEISAAAIDRILELRDRTPLSGAA
jgi:Zn-dependent peptidase ImmA (M78 family)/transcriptional regulator with XRE-family HTH domain